MGDEISLADLFSQQYQIAKLCHLFGRVHHEHVYHKSPSDADVQLTGVHELSYKLLPLISGTFEQSCLLMLVTVTGYHKQCQLAIEVSSHT